MRQVFGSIAGLMVLAGCAGATDEREEACKRIEGVWSLDAMPTTTCTRSTPEFRDLAAEPKLAVAVYHFNVQYVAGGLKGFPDGELTRANDFDEAELEDRIVTQGLEPVLDMFLANPSFAADIELQGYMVEIVAIRHPAVLEKMRTLAARGQIEFDSFHYSDQLYIAYPKEDLDVSLDLVEGVFGRACLPIGRSVFTQEGQFAAGQLPIAKARGRHTSVFPKNLFFHQHGRDLTADGVLFEDPRAEGHVVVVGGQGFRNADFELRWTFMDDGEIAFSEGRLNPYFGLDYVLDPGAIAAHVERLKTMEAEGFVHATIAEATEAMTKRGLAPRSLPASMDGTWQPDDTGNVYRWMGGSGLFRAQERDSDVLAAIWRARNAVERAQATITEDDEPAKRGVLAAWRHALLAQVSDSTGWNPFVGEVDYSFSTAERAEAIAKDVLACVGASSSDEPLACTGTSVVDGDLSPFGADIIAPTREVFTTVQTCMVEETEVKRITLATRSLVDEEPLFDATEAEGMDRNVEIRFGPLSRPVELAAALEDRTTTYDLDAFAFEWTGIPLPHGLIRLADDRWVIQELATGRTAAVLTSSGADAGVVRFPDTTVSRASASERRYYIVDDVEAEEAFAIAARINRPEVNR